MLGDSDNAIVLEWGWRANERETDPFATHFRVYLSSPLDVVPCEIQGVMPVGGRPGAFVATARLDREIDAGTAKGQYLSAPYPFFVEDHTAGRDISLTLVTRLPGPNGAFNEPAPGPTSAAAQPRRPADPPPRLDASGSLRRSRSPPSRATGSSSGTG